MSKFKGLTIHQQRDVASLVTREQQYTYMLMMETGDFTIPYIPTPPWIKQLGQDLNKLVKDGKIKHMWFDENKVVQVNHELNT